jgi:hypothetical protein
MNGRFVKQGDDLTVGRDMPSGAFAKYCCEVLPGMLEICEVPASDAERVVEDISSRAEAAARMNEVSLEILAAPFYEESFTHNPENAPAWMKAVTTLVIRNSRLEEMHADGGSVRGGQVAITTHGLMPLLHFIAVRRQSSPPDGPADDQFVGLEEEYPRAWACLKALRMCINTGRGRIGYRLPQGAVPELPASSEVIEAEPAGDVETPSGDSTVVVFSGIDSRFDQHGFHVLEMAAEHERFLVALSSLSRISRNSRKLHRVLEFLLAHHARILTTNYLLTEKEVWVRRRDPIEPDSWHMMKGFEDLGGLSGAHRKTVESWVQRASSMDELSTSAEGDLDG